MKKTMMALCSAIIILASSLLTPASVCAAERSCPPHEFNSIVSNQFCYVYSSHPYVISNGPGGPQYGTCYITTYGSCEYLKCGKCDYVNTSNPINFQPISVTHSACGQ